MTMALSTAAKFAQGHQRLWAIYDRFQGDSKIAYSHSSGDLSFATLHQAVQRLLPALAALPRSSQRRPILIWGHKDVCYPIAYWACLLAGHALVPVEPETPPERIRQIVETCDPSVILVADQAAAIPSLASFAVEGELTVMPLAPPEKLAGSTGPMAVREFGVSPADIAYIMFSSGTLGQPKGIQITYANLLDFIDWLEPLLSPSTLNGGVSGIIRHCFDVSLFELWASWTRKLSLCALDHTTISDSTGYIARLAASRVSLWVSTPSLVRLFLRNRRFCSDTLPDLKTFLFCGEPLTKPIVRELFARFGSTCRIVNTYGPTECTVAVTATDIKACHLDSADELPIGYARPGTTLHHPPGTPAGQAAELWISGASVGAGYIGLPQKQAQAFPRQDLYRSGDLSRVDAEGQWYFLGRIDREVKVQGLRVDLNEIEAHLRRQPGVEDAVVEPHVIHGEARALQAFIVGPTNDGDLARLAFVLARELPPYLVPRFWYAGFPEALNLNSKLDRKQLADATLSARLRHVHMAAIAAAPAEQHKESAL